MKNLIAKSEVRYSDCTIRMEIGNLVVVSDSESKVDFEYSIDKSKGEGYGIGYDGIGAIVNALRELRRRVREDMDKAGMTNYWHAIPFISRSASKNIDDFIQDKSDGYISYFLENKRLP